MATASEFVILRGGLAVPLAPVRLLLELEARGLRVTRDGLDLLVIPGGQLTPEERAALTRWKSHVLALLDYEPPSLQ